MSFRVSQVAILLVGCLAQQVTASLLVHYTFDDNSISGSTVLDSAGFANNATIINNVGTGVPGVLGSAIRLPNDDGSSYVRLPAALNPAPAGNDPRTIAFFFSQEQVGSENKMFGYGTANPGRSFDVSLEGGGIRLRYSGGNVTWGSGLDFVGSDAGFHHLAIRVPAGAFDYLDVELLLDGTPLIGVATGGNPGGTAIDTGGGVATNLDIGRSPAFAAEGDFIGLIDDFRIYNTALSDEEIRILIPSVASLVLEVDPLTGVGTIRNRSAEVIELDYYELSSPQPALQSATWMSLQSQDRIHFPSGSGVGDGWEELGVPTSKFLAEGILQGLSSLEPGAWIDLGVVFDPAASQNLSFTYGLAGDYRTSPAQFLIAGPTADFDRDGEVDSADLVRWQSSYGLDGAADATGNGHSDGADFLQWQRQFTRSSALRTSATAVPEPTSLILGILASALLGYWRLP